VRFILPQFCPTATHSLALASNHKVPSPTGNLEKLKLTQCRLTGHQLLRFVNSPQPFLKALSLTNVSGFSNADLRSLLTQVAPTLSSLYINYIKIPRPSPDEEYAVDATVAKMVALRILDVAGDCVSLLAVMRKAPAHPDDVGLSSPSSTATPTPSIRISYAPAVDFYNHRGLLEALEVTGWRSVTIYGGGFHNEPSVAHLEEVRNIAMARGITLLI